MVALGGFGAAVPARVGGTGDVLRRVLTTTTATYLLIQLIAVCGGAFIWAGALLFALPAWLVDGLLVLLTVAILFVAVTVARQVWDIEGMLAPGRDPGAS